MSAAIIIPVYKPGPVLLQVVSSITALTSDPVIVVDDGSGPEFEPVFQGLQSFPSVSVLRHAVNLGKGAALKTAMNHVLVRYPYLTGVVTTDGDGQHAPEDVVRVAHKHEQLPGSLILGSRDFQGTVPWRSRVGNELTRILVRLLVGQRLRDTQTGLRAIPRALQQKLLLIPSQRYEFELEMLIAARHLGRPILEEPIRTIYEPRNPSSHFNPLLDSVRIYFVLFRFSVLSLLTAGVDNLIFLLAYPFTGSIGLSQLCSRAVAV